MRMPSTEIRDEKVDEVICRVIMLVRNSNLNIFQQYLCYEWLGRAASNHLIEHIQEKLV